MDGAAIDRGLAALKMLAAERGNEIDAARLPVDDLAFLAELPIGLRRGEIDQRHLTVQQSRRLYDVLDRASGCSVRLGDREAA